MKFNMTDAHMLLAARIDDLIKASDRGEPVCGNFLTPGEAAFALAYLKEKREEKRVLFLGGYADAERRRLVAIPPYLLDMDGDAVENMSIYFPEIYENAVRAIKICGSGYRKLFHKDYLGSLLALGIERSAIGDIIVLDDSSAVVFCTDKMHSFLLSDVDRIANDKVSCRDFVPEADFSPTREFMPIRDTVASNRLDCVVGALTDLSREKAQNIIRSGLCEVDYLPEERCDVSVPVPCVVTVRGHGKYRVLSFDGETKKGRLRLVAQKYV
jgi:RNA-binding protein YlmH